MKPSILIGINSYMWIHEKYLTGVLNTFAAYTKYEPTIVLATKYPYTYTGSATIVDNSLNVVYVQSPYVGFEHCYANHQYLVDNYSKHDYVISMDDDIIIPEAAIDYYVANQNISASYIPGVLTYEVTKAGDKVLLATNPWLPRKITETLTIDGKQYVVFYSPHSACFIADRSRFTKAIASGLSVTPKVQPPATPCDWARDDIYTGFNKVVGVDDILSGSALVWHSTNRYQGYGDKYLTAQELFALPLPNAQPQSNVKPHAMRGLGDAVAVLAQPIARTIDKVTGGRTNVAGCGGCKRRQEKLNKLVPFH